MLKPNGNVLFWTRMLQYCDYIVLFVTTMILSIMYRNTAMKAFSVQYGVQDIQHPQSSMAGIVFVPSELQANK